MDALFNIVKKGYDTAEVKKYIEEIETVLASYKEKDAAIKSAIINAQLAADSIVEKAHAEAERIKGEAVLFLDGVLSAVDSHKDNICLFKDEYVALVNKYTKQFEENDAVKLISDAAGIEAYLDKIKTSIIEGEGADAETVSKT